MSCCGGKKTPFTKHSIVKAGVSVIKHFTDPTYNAFCTEEEKNDRVKVCETCENIEEFYDRPRCKVCLCFINAKASLKDQTCPHPNGDKWLKEIKPQ